MVDPWLTHGRPMVDPWFTCDATVVDPCLTRTPSVATQATHRHGTAARKRAGRPAHHTQTCKAVAPSQWTATHARHSRGTVHYATKKGPANTAARMPMLAAGGRGGQRRGSAPACRQVRAHAARRPQYYDGAAPRRQACPAGAPRPGTQFVQPCHCGACARSVTAAHPRDGAGTAPRRHRQPWTPRPRRLALRSNSRGPPRERTQIGNTPLPWTLPPRHRRALVDACRNKVWQVPHGNVFRGRQPEPQYHHRASQSSSQWAAAPKCLRSVPSVIDP